MLESVVTDMEAPSAQPVCEALSCIPVLYIKHSHAWLPPMHYHCPFEGVSKITMAMIAQCAQRHGKRHSMSYDVLQQCPTKQGQVQRQLFASCNRDMLQSKACLARDVAYL